MRYIKGIAVSAFLFSLFAGVAVAAPRASPTNPTIHLARRAVDVPAPPVAVPSTGTAVENPVNLADNVDAANTTSTDAGGDTGTADATDALGGLLSGLKDIVGSIVSGLTGAVGNVTDGATDSSAVGDLLGGLTDSSAVGDLLGGLTGSNAIGDLLGSITDTIDGVVGGATGAAGSVGLKRNDRRAFFRRRLDARYFEDLA